MPSELPSGTSPANGDTTEEEPGRHARSLGSVFAECWKFRRLRETVAASPACQTYATARACSPLLLLKIPSSFNCSRLMPRRRCAGSFLLHTRAMPDTGVMTATVAYRLATLGARRIRGRFSRRSDHRWARQYRPAHRYLSRTNRSVSCCWRGTVNGPSTAHLYVGTRRKRST